MMRHPASWARAGGPPPARADCASASEAEAQLSWKAAHVLAHMLHPAKTCAHVSTHMHQLRRRHAVSHDRLPVQAGEGPPPQSGCIPLRRSRGFALRGDEQAEPVRAQPGIQIDSRHFGEVGRFETHSTQHTQQDAGT